MESIENQPSNSDLLNMIDEEIKKSKVRKKMNLNYPVSQPVNINLEQKPPRSKYDSNRSRDMKDSTSENHRYNSVPAKSNSDSFQDSDKKYSSNVHMSPLSKAENSSYKSMSRPSQQIKIDSVIDSLKHLQKQIDEDFDGLKYRLRDIANSELISVDKIHRIIAST